MTVVVVICAVLLAGAAAGAVIRVERGPSMLDRTVALDVLTAVLAGSVALHAAWTGRTDTIPVLVALSLVGFVGSVAIARFAAVETEGEGRVLSREEIAELEADRRRHEETELRANDSEHHGGGAEGEIRREHDGVGSLGPRADDPAGGEAP